MKQDLFNPARFLHYLRKDWSENRIQFLYDLVFPYSILTLLFRWVVVPSMVLSMTNWVDLTCDAMSEMLEVIRCLWESLFVRMN